MNMNEIITGVKLSKLCSIKPDKDSEESKQINLVIEFNGTTLQSVFEKAVSGAVIAWQNGVGRKGFDTYKSGQTVEIQFASPAKNPAKKSSVDPETAMVLKLRAMTQDEATAYLKSLAAKAAK